MLDLNVRPDCWPDCWPGSWPGSWPDCLAWLLYLTVRPDCYTWLLAWLFGLTVIPDYWPDCYTDYYTWLSGLTIWPDCYTWLLYLTVGLTIWPDCWPGSIAVNKRGEGDQQQFSSRDVKIVQECFRSAIQTHVYLFTLGKKLKNKMKEDKFLYS